MRRAAWLAAIVAIVTAGCGGSGGGGGGGGFDPGPLHWGVPFVATTPSTTFVVGLRNLDSASTTATLQGYKPDGSPYPGPVLVELDGEDEARLALGDALGGATPVGGWVLASTPSQAVEVWFADRPAAKLADEASRAIPLPDLGAPLAPLATGANVTAETTGFQIANVTSTPITVTVTPYETAPDPFDPPIEGSVVLVSLGAFESVLVLPQDLTGTPWGTGSLQLAAATPFFVAGIEDLAYDLPTVSPTLRTLHAALTFGRVLTDVPDFYDFVMIARNDTDDTEAVTILGIYDAQGTPLITSPRVLQIPPRGAWTILTTEAPFDDLFGDVFVSPFARDLHFEIQVPEGVDLAFRQFDPVLLSYNATVRPMPVGFVVDVMDVVPNPTTTQAVRTFASILNPASAQISVTVQALVPEPDGFAASPQPLGTFTVPAHGRVDVSPDALTFLDRDLVPATSIGLRFTSNISFAVTGVRETRSIINLVYALSPLVVRPHENAR